MSEFYSKMPRFVFLCAATESAILEGQASGIPTTRKREIAAPFSAPLATRSPRVTFLQWCLQQTCRCGERLVRFSLEGRFTPSCSATPRCNANMPRSPNAPPPTRTPRRHVSPAPGAHVTTPSTSEGPSCKVSSQPAERAESGRTNFKPTKGEPHRQNPQQQRESRPGKRKARSFRLTLPEEPSIGTLKTREKSDVEESLSPCGDSDSCNSITGDGESKSCTRATKRPRVVQDPKSSQIHVWARGYSPAGPAPPSGTPPLITSQSRGGPGKSWSSATFSMSGCGASSAGSTMTPDPTMYAEAGPFNKDLMRSYAQYRMVPSHAPRSFPGSSAPQVRAERCVCCVFGVVRGVVHLCLCRLCSSRRSVSRTPRVLSQAYHCTPPLPSSLGTCCPSCSPLPPFWATPRTCSQDRVSHYRDHQCGQLQPHRLHHPRLFWHGRCGAAIHNLGLHSLKSSLVRGVDSVVVLWPRPCSVRDATALAETCR